MKKPFLLTILIIGVLLASFVIGDPDEAVFIPPSKQRTEGDSAKGYYYLVNGDYVKGGVPDNIFRMGIGKPIIYLKRDSVNEGIPHDFTAVKAMNGEIVIAPNCLQCHAQVFEGNLYIGLGNTFVDFSDEPILNKKNLEKAEKFLKTLSPKKYKASLEFFEVAKTVGPLLYTQPCGVNSAD